MYYEVIEANNIDRYKLVLIFENGKKGTVDLFILTKSWVYCAGLMMWTLRQKPFPARQLENHYQN